MAELTEAQKKEVERLRSKHPEYKEREEEWEFFLSAYEGGSQYVSDKTLFKHQREHPEDFQDRKSRAYYANYCQALVDFVPEFIYSQGVNRQPPKDQQKVFDNFIKDVDRSGTALDAFMEAVAEDARIFGHTWVGVDKPQRPVDTAGQELSLARVEELKLDVPYFYHVRPLEILDWITDQFGNYLYMKRKQIFWEKSGKRGFRKIERYTEWYEDQIVISKIDITDGENERLLPKEKLANAWGLIPFQQFFYKRSKFNKDLGVSFLTDLAYQNRAVFNLTSYLEEFLARQCFNVLTMEQATQVPTRDRSDGRIGTSNVIWIPRDAKHRPEYVSPPVEPSAFIQDERSNIVREMYRQAAQDILSEIFGKSGVAPSGDAQKQAFARTIPMIAKQAEMMQSAEHNLWRLWSKLQKKDWAEGIVSYRDDYGITNLQDLLLQLSTIFNNLKVLPPTFVRAEWKRIIKEFDGKLPPEVLEKAFEEIDALSDEEITHGYKLADLQVESDIKANDVKAAQGVPSTANMIQGREQRALGTDKKIGARQKSRAATKEANPDSNRRSTRAKGHKASR